MLAHHHGQVLNTSELGRSLGVSHHTVRPYLDLLASTFVVRVLPPWFANPKKRQVKSPKVYIADSGLLGLEALDDLLAHPNLGASWEGFLLGAVIDRLGLRPDECHFWAAHAGAELDLLVVRGQRRRGFELKRTVAPKLTPSMRSALADLELDRLDAVHAGRHSSPLAERVRAVSAWQILDELAEPSQA